MDQLIAFLQERWFVVTVVLVALFIVIKIVKTVMKWAIVIALLAGLLFYGANYTDKLKEMSGKIVSEVKDALKDEALKALAGQDTTYKERPDGTFTITRSGIELEGKAGSNEVKLIYKGQSITLKMDDTIKALIEQAKKNG